MSNELVNGLYAKEGTQDFIVAKLSIKASDFSQFLIDKEQLVRDNNGWLNVDVLRSRKGGLYVGYSTWKPKNEITTSQHSPDREIVDLPF